MADMKNMQEPQFDPTSKSMLAGYVILGFFFGIFGVLITWLIVRKFTGTKKSDPIMFSLMGLGLGMLFEMTLMFLFGFNPATMLGGSAGSSASVW